MTRSIDTSLGSFDARIRVTLRLARKRDLRPLEWLGMFVTHRVFIEEAFARQRQGEVLMLLAVVREFPVGQLWVDLARKRDAGIGVLWALRVLPGLRGTGIGTRLLQCAEAQLRERGIPFSEIGVEQDNPDARRLYERMGYVAAGIEHDVAEYVTPAGHRERMEVEQWILRKPLAPESPSAADSDDEAVRTGALATSARGSR